jgi:homoserine acetyltransferase
VDFELYRAGDVRLQRGDLLEGATLADKSYGELAADKSNLILLLTPFGRDNVELQRRLINEVFHADRVKLALGWSMGGQATTRQSRGHGLCQSDRRRVSRTWA